MSTKQQLAEAIATLPDSLSLEEAVERLYRAFKLKQSLQKNAAGGGLQAADPLKNDPSLRVIFHEDPTAPLDVEDWPDALR